MVSAIISRVVILVFGTLYPAYASYKAVKTKNVKEYVKWMMYWIVFALFTCLETFADILISWLPFYYEIKIVFVLWLLSPATKGSSILYRKFVHPQLVKREKKIDAYIQSASDKGYSALLKFGSKGLNYVTNVAVTTAIKGQTTIVDHLKKSYSMSDLSPQSSGISLREQPSVIHDEEETEDNVDNRLIEERERANRRIKKSRHDEEEYVSKRHTYHEEFSSNNSGSGGTYSADEADEEEVHPIPTAKRQSTRTTRYSHKEASHYGTLPRSRNTRKSTRSTVTGYTEWS